MKRIRIPTWALHVAVGVLLAVLVAWGFYRRWKILASSPFPLGVDGYFYPIQVRSLLDTGSLRFAASPLAFWWMAPFAAATDPIVGAKLGAALGTALGAVPAYLVGARLGRGRGPGLLAAAIVASSPASIYLSVEFVKQGIGLTVALFSLWLALRAIEQRTRAPMIAAGLGLAAALLAHKTAAAFVLVASVPAAIAQLRGTGKFRGRRLLYAMIGAAATAILALVLGLAFPERFLSPSDLALAGDLFTGSPRFDGAALAGRKQPLVFDYEVVIAMLLGIATLVVFQLRHANVQYEKSRAERTVATVAAVLAIALWCPWFDVGDQQGLAFRLRVSAYVPLALCAAVIARVTLDKLRELERDAVCVIFGALIALRTPKHEGEVVAHPALIASAAALADHVPSNATVIIPERHIAFMVAWYANAKISMRPEQVPYPQRVRLLLPLSPVNQDWPLASTVDKARLERTIDPPLGLHPRHRNGFVLVTERTWDWMLAHMPEDARAHYAAWPTI